VELRDYGSIIRRRLWIILLIVIIVGLYSGYQYYKLRKIPGALKTSQSQVTLLIGLQANSGVSIHNNYSDYVSVSESIADEYTLGPTLTSPSFDHLVYQQILTDESQSGSHPDLGGLQEGNIGGALSAGRVHSLVTVTATWPNGAGAQAIAKAVGEVTTKHIDEYMDYVISNNSSLSTAATRPVIAARVVTGATAPITTAGSSASKPTLLAALMLVGLIIGIALAFLIEYLDDRIRRANDAVQLLQLPVYGEIPHAPSPGQASRKA
jgi:capsular polysaccharide biosynthesis protein